MGDPPPPPPPLTRRAAAGGSRTDPALAGVVVCDKERTETYVVNVADLPPYWKDSLLSTNETVERGQIIALVRATWAMDGEGAAADAKAFIRCPPGPDFPMSD